MSSRYEKNLYLQPELIRRVLDAECPTWMDELRGKRLFFVGIGTSFHAAQIACCLWRRHVSAQAQAVHSFDFVRLPQPVASGDVVVLISHRGTKSFTVQAAASARRAGAVTVAITGKGSFWEESITHRLESSEMEDSGVFTKSMTSTMAWIARWIGNSSLLDGLRQACAKFEEGPSFPAVVPGTDIVLLGDLEREWVAREISLKIQEAAYFPARAFGLEEFLHGPRVSVGAKSRVVAFSAAAEPRWQAVRDYLRIVEVPLLEVSAEGIAPSAAWLWQLFWGQRLTLDICRNAGVDPDAMKTGDPRYQKARESLEL